MRNIREEIKHCKSQAEVDEYMKNNPITPKDIVEAICDDKTKDIAIEGRLCGITEKKITIIKEPETIKEPKTKMQKILRRKQPTEEDQEENQVVITPTCFVQRREDLCHVNAIKEEKAPVVTKLKQ